MRTSTCQKSTSRIKSSPSTVSDDEHAVYYAGTGLLPALQEPGTSFPTFKWAADGKLLRRIAAADKKKLVIAVSNIGFLGFYAGPDVWIVDNFALTDPLLARLPPPPDPYWRTGHFWRAFRSAISELCEAAKTSLGTLDSRSTTITWC